MGFHPVHQKPSANLTIFCFSFPCAPPSSAGWSGGVGEDCLSTQCEFRSRLTSRATQGTPQGRETGGAFSLATLFWRSKRKLLAAGHPPATLICFLIDQGRSETCPYTCPYTCPHTCPSTCPTT